MFLPTTMEEVRKLGWDSLDIILISGDTYIDSSYNGSALIGKWLYKHGFKVGIIAQPDINSDTIQQQKRKEKVMILLQEEKIQEDQTELQLYILTL